MTERTSATEADAAAAVRRGEVIAVATDTVYGLVCDPTDAAAVQRVYDLKRRPDGLELSLLAAASRDLEGLVRWSPSAERFAVRFWPGALSLILPVGERRLAIPRAGTTLSVRVPGAAALRRLLRHTGPLASTSANRHGEDPATTAAEVRRVFADEVGIVLDLARPLGTASSIIDCSVTPPRVLRSGPIDAASLQAVLAGVSAHRRVDSRGG